MTVDSGQNSEDLNFLRTKNGLERDGPSILAIIAEKNRYFLHFWRIIDITFT